MQLVNRFRKRARSIPGNRVLAWVQTGIIAARSSLLITKIILKELWLSLNALILNHATYRHQGIILRFKISSSVELKRVRNKGQPFILNEFLSQLTVGSTYYDIGANIGIFALPAARMVGPKGLVVAFEPGFANYHRLVENSELNNLTNLVPFGLALSSENKTSLLYRPSDRLGEGGNSILDSRPFEGTKSQIQLARLDDVVSLWNLSIPNFMKIDVEGAELDVLAGMPNILASNELHTIVCEVGISKGHRGGREVTHNAVSNYLGKYGFIEVAKCDSGNGLNDDVMYVKKDFLTAGS